MSYHHVYGMGVDTQPADNQSDALEAAKWKSALSWLMNHGAKFMQQVAAKDWVSADTTVEDAKGAARQLREQSRKPRPQGQMSAKVYKEFQFYWRKLESAIQAYEAFNVGDVSQQAFTYPAEGVVVQTSPTSNKPIVLGVVAGIVAVLGAGVYILNRKYGKPTTSARTKGSRTSARRKSLRSSKS